MKKLGVAISVHSKLDALATTVRVIREAWDERDVMIAVCCNSRETIGRIEELDVDVVVPGEFDIPTSPKPYLRSRQFDCIKKSVSACVGHARHTMHIHADACALDSGPIMSILGQMKGDDLKMAFRGRGLDTGNLKTPDGDVDDHFLFFDCAAVRDSGFFECEPLPLLVEHNVENLLAKRMRTVFRPEEWWHYSGMEKNVVHESALGVYPDGINHRNMNPFNYDPERKFLHAATLDLARPFMERVGLAHCVTHVKLDVTSADAVDVWMAT